MTAMDGKLDPSPPPVDQTVEIKARCRDFEPVRARLRQWGAEFAGIDRQRDTFYRVPAGHRLKLRRSENFSRLISYRRTDGSGPKHCLVDLYDSLDPVALDRALRSSLGVRAEVVKTREVYLLGRTRFHLDRVEGLGTFLEIEVLGRRAEDPVERLRALCREYLEGLAIGPEDLVAAAYVDLLEQT